MKGESILVNEHGTWQITRVVTPRGYRYQLWYAHAGKWWLVANQGRRKTCVELASSGYNIGEFKS